MGNYVTCVDLLEEKIKLLKQGTLPIYEPGLKELVERNASADRLRFTTSYSEGLDNCDFIFIAVNTPTSTSEGGADMRYVESAARRIAQELDHYAIIINKSTAACRQRCCRNTHHSQQSRATGCLLCRGLEPRIFARRVSRAGFPESRPRGAGVC